MLRIIVGAFLVLHGLVYLLYAGHSWRLFELADLAWPDDSWAFSRLLGMEALRALATVSCILAALGFVAGGAGVFAGWAGWRPVVVGAAAFSAVIFVLFWDGRLQKLPDQGWIGVLISAAILVTVLLRWPEFDF
ncbi:MAG: hypothetical protein JSU61_06535 [Fidelibacterota bacterium]|nr:MAG: hypothetical protein JSU61_06535 [Candidatus Neomarinimicrobiota bacterium]